MIVAWDEYWLFKSKNNCDCHRRRGLGVIESYGRNFAMRVCTAYNMYPEYTRELTTG